MKVIEKIMEIAKNNNGIITADMVTEEGISRGNLKYMTERHFLEKSARGVYVLPEVWEDEFFNLQARFKKGVYANETALFLHDLADRTPNKFVMMFPRTYNLSNVKKEGAIIPILTKKEYYELGISTSTSPAGNTVNTYNMERTLCEVVRPYNSIDIQLISEAFKRYAEKKSRNIPLLSEYAKILKVENKIRSYLEVLL